MVPESSIPNSQELSTCSYPGPDHSSPHHPILYLPSTDFNFLMFDNYFLCSSCRAPSLTIGRVCTLQWNHLMVQVVQSPSSYFTVSSVTLPPWRAWSQYLYLPGTGWPSYNRGYWIPFRLLLLAGLRWRYSNPSQRSLTGQSRVAKLRYDGESVNKFRWRAHSGLVTRRHFPSEGFCRKVTFLFLSLWGALSDQRSGLPFSSLSL
jgi:hypothetical protein